MVLSLGRQLEKVKYRDDTAIDLYVLVYFCPKLVYLE